MTRFRTFRLIMCAIAVTALAMWAEAVAVAHTAPYKVTAGTAPSNGTLVTFTLTSTENVVFNDMTTNQKITCTSDSFAGTGVTSASASGSALLSIDGGHAIYRSCAGPLGLKFDLSGYGTWFFNVSDSTRGFSIATVSNIRLHVKSTAGPQCEFDLASVDSSTGFASSSTATATPGTTLGNYSNDDTSLYIGTLGTKSLGVWNVRNSNETCVSRSVFAKGDRFSMTNQTRLTASSFANNPVAIN